MKPWTVGFRASTKQKMLGWRSYKRTYIILFITTRVRELFVLKKKKNKKQIILIIIINWHILLRKTKGRATRRNPSRSKINKKSRKKKIKIIIIRKKFLWLKLKAKIYLRESRVNPKKIMMMIGRTKNANQSPKKKWYLKWF